MDRILSKEDSNRQERGPVRDPKRTAECLRGDDLSPPEVDPPRQTAVKRGESSRTKPQRSLPRIIREYI